MRFTLLERYISDSYYDEASATLQALRPYMRKHFPNYKEIDCYETFDGYIVQFDKPLTHDMVTQLNNRLGSKKCEITHDKDIVKIFNL